MIERRRSIGEAVVPAAAPRPGMFGRPRAVLVETSICRSRGSARGPKTPAKAGRRGSSRRSRTSMNTCSDRARRPAGADLRTGARKVLAPSFPGGRRLDPAEAGRIDVRPGKAGSATGERERSRAPHSGRGRGVRGSSDGASCSRESCSTASASRESAARAATRPEAGDVPSSTEPLEAG